MTTKRVAILTSVVLCAVVAFVLSALPSSAQDPPEPIAVEFLTGRAVFTDKVHLRVKVKHQGEKRLVVKDKDPSTTVVARFTVQPGPR